MAGSVFDDSFTGKFFAANFTVDNTVIRCRSFAIAGNFVFFNCVCFNVAFGINVDSFAGKFFAANFTVNNAVIGACIYTAGRNIVFGNSISFSVTGSRDFGICSVLTSGAVFICIPTDFFAGCFLSVNGHDIVIAVRIA